MAETELRIAGIGISKDDSTVVPAQLEMNSVPH